MALSKKEEKRLKELLDKKKKAEAEERKWYKWADENKEALLKRWEEAANKVEKKPAAKAPAAKAPAAKAPNK